MTGQRVGYPSSDLPGETGFSIDLPTGWVASPAPGVSFVAAPAVADDVPHMTLVASVRRIDPRVTATDLSEALGVQYQELDGCTVAAVEDLTIGDRTAAVRRLEHSGEEGSRVLQIQAIAVVPVCDEAADAVTITVTVPEGADPTDLAPGIVASLRVAGPVTMPEEH
jgi:hypothetical protein